MASILSRKGRIYRVIEVCALVFMAAFMLVFASKQSFWIDELDWMIGIITGKAIFNGRLFTGMFQTLLEQGYNLPLYYLIEKPFYELMPYGEVFLLIPSIVFVLLGIIILKKAGAAIGGEDLGFIAVCIGVSSTILMVQGGWELRPYSMTFCFSALTLLRYVKRLKAETGKNILLYGMALTLLLFSHWFGSILALFYAFADLYRYIRKEIALKCILSYILAGVFIIPWFLLMALHHTVNLSSYWVVSPGILAPVGTAVYLLSNRVLYCLCFGVGFIVMLCKWIKSRGIKKNSENIWLFMGISMVWTIVPVWFYSNFINPGGSFYVHRYFFVLMPQAFLITGYGFLETFRAVEGRLFAAENKKKYLYGIAVLLFCLSCFQAYRKAYSDNSSIREPYREAAEYLSKDGRVYGDNSLVLCSTGGAAWIEYYFNKRGFTLPANAAGYEDKGLSYYEPEELYLFIEDNNYIQPVLLSEEALSKYDNIFLFEVHRLFPEALLGAIGETHSLKNEMPEFGPPPPKKPPKNQKPLPFGIREYTKRP